MQLIDAKGANQDVKDKDLHEIVDTLLERLVVFEGLHGDKLALYGFVRIRCFEIQVGLEEVGSSTHFLEEVL